MAAQAGVPSSEAAVLLKQGLEQMEQDIKAGTVPTDSVFTSLAEVDSYFFSSKQADGAQITGILFRTRVAPFMCFAVAPIVPLNAESVRIVNSRLPAPPPPSKAPPFAGPAADPRQSSKAAQARKAGEAARAAAAARAAQNPNTPPGAYTPPPPPPGMDVPPPLEDEDGVRQG